VQPLNFSIPLDGQSDRKGLAFGMRHAGVRSQLPDGAVGAWVSCQGVDSARIRLRGGVQVGWGVSEVESDLLGHAGGHHRNECHYQVKSFSSDGTLPTPSAQPPW